jgi:hypothetical protein
MNAKNFIVGGIVGGIVNFLLGWVFYGMLLKDTFPQSGTENMTFIFLGCMSFGFLLSFIFSLSDGITKCVPGLKTAAIIGLFLGLYSDFFGNMTKAAIDYKLMALDVVTTIVISALVGATIAVVNGKMK